MMGSVSESTPIPRKPRWLLRTGIPVGVAFAAAIILAVVAPDSAATQVLGLVFAIAFLAWLAWAIGRFDKYVTPDPKRQLRHQLSQILGTPSLRRPVLLSLPLLMGIPLAVIGAVAHVHGLVVAGLVILAVGLVVSSVALPALSAWARRSQAKRRTT